MRKAFDVNIPRTKPRLRLGGFSSIAVEEAASDFPPPSIPQAEEAMVAEIEAPVARSDAAPSLDAERPPMSAPVTTEPVPARASRGTEVPVAKAKAALSPTERRERLKERLRAASAKVEPSQPTPQSPGEARASGLALVAQLRQETEDAAALNASLNKDLEQARAELARAAQEAHSRTEEANRMATEVAERSRLIEELGREMASLEAERDDSLVELRNARAQTEQLTEARRGLEQKLAEREAELAETLSEEERLASELEGRAVDLKRVEAALAALTEERDRLAGQVTALTHERAELLESQKALDEIHRALAEARSRMSARPGA